MGNGKFAFLNSQIMFPCIGSNKSYIANCKSQIVNYTSKCNPLKIKPFLLIKAKHKVHVLYSLSRSTF